MPAGTSWTSEPSQQAAPSHLRLADGLSDLQREAFRLSRLDFPAAHLSAFWFMGPVYNKIWRYRQL